MSGWGTRGRGPDLPPDWAARRDAVNARAQGQCEATDPATGLRCAAHGTECHHAVDRHDHRLQSLQWLCTECHAVITHQQAADARRAIQAKRLHPNRRSPGLID